MAEEEKKATVAEDKKPEEELEKAAAEEEEKKEPPPENENKEEKKSPEIVLRVFMHCEGCARKVRRCLTGFQGVEEVEADCRGSRVVVKGEKADPVKVLEWVQKKSHRKVELISPIPTPPPPPPPQLITEELHKIEEPNVITVVLGVYMHCDACAQEIKRRIHRMKVQIVEPDLRGSQVKVKGFFEPQKLVDYVYKRTGKHATVIKVEPEKKEEPKPDETQEAKESKENKENKAEKESEEKEEKKEEQIGKENNEDAGEDGGATTTAAAGGGDGGGEPPAKEEADEAKDQKQELIKKEFYYYYPQNHQLNYPIYPPRFVHEINAYPPQMFSDENPNACSVM
ncbi:heavy metal transport/detoxification superfamily protein [Striga asiatica]|uniref:Heavy metal transport/detoxification superfamily protein n=1 Tax=Striga asiatica TaxID=4170 RepID=A0A5A7QKW6_STRAF|nr:heavy metal transport/detoxification superfamily protein [Striga asiatica]